MTLALVALGVVQIPIADRRADFAEFVRLFKENYAYVDRRERPWESWATRYREAVDRAETPEAFAEVVSTALAEAHDFHAEVRAKNPHRQLPCPTFADFWVKVADGRVIVEAVRTGSDAARAGIQTGQTLLTARGEPIAAAMDDALTGPLDPRSPSARRWAALAVATGRSDEARRFTLRRPDGSTFEVELPAERRFERPPGRLTVLSEPGGVIRIRFNNSFGDQRTVADFDAALATHRRAKGLILDLRDIPSGGDSSVALGILGRLVDRMTPYQRHRIPNYGQADVERNWVEMVAPRGPFTYCGPVVALVDHWTGSMAEGFAIGLDGMKRAKVVGTEMARLAGAVSDFTLPKTHIDVAFATEQTFHVNGRRREEWLPPILVGPGDGDPILARGLRCVGR